MPCHLPQELPSPGNHGFYSCYVFHQNEFLPMESSSTGTFSHLKELSSACVRRILVWPHNLSNEVPHVSWELVVNNSNFFFLKMLLCENELRLCLKENIRDLGQNFSIRAILSGKLHHRKLFPQGLRKRRAVVQYSQTEPVGEMHSILICSPTIKTILELKPDTHVSNVL